MKDLGVRAARWTTNWVAQMNALEASGLSPQLRQLSNGSIYFEGPNLIAKQNRKGATSRVIFVAAGLVVTFAGTWFLLWNRDLNLMPESPKSVIAQGTTSPKPSPQISTNCDFQEPTLESLLAEHPSFVSIAQIRLGDVRQLTLAGDCAGQKYSLKVRLIGNGDASRIEKVAYSTE